MSEMRMVGGDSKVGKSERRSGINRDGMVEVKKVATAGKARRARTARMSKQEPKIKKNSSNFQ